LPTLGAKCRFTILTDSIVSVIHQTDIASGFSLLVAYPISIAQYRAGFGCPHI
jgi:hypothetical protein